MQRVLDEVSERRAVGLRACPADMFPIEAICSSLFVPPGISRDGSVGKVMLEGQVQPTSCGECNNTHF